MTSHYRKNIPCIPNITNYSNIMSVNVYPMCCRLNYTVLYPSSYHGNKSMMSTSVHIHGEVIS